MTKLEWISDARGQYLHCEIPTDSRTQDTGYGDGDYIEYIKYLDIILIHRFNIRCLCSPQWMRGGSAEDPGQPESPVHVPLAVGQAAPAQ